MRRGRKTELNIILSPEEQKTLHYLARAPTVAAGVARRARIIMLLSDKKPIVDIAEYTGLSRKAVYKWGSRFMDLRIEGLKDKIGRGRPRKQQEVCV
jgi:hypothetical protein